MGIIERVREMSFTQVFNYYLGFISFVFCIFPKLIPITLLGLCCCMIIGYKKRKISFQFSLPLFLLFLLYVAYLIGVCFTHHFDIAAKYLEYKLSFIIFPLLLSFRFHEKVSLKGPHTGLIAGVITASVLGLIHSWFNYQQFGDFNNSFGSVRFSYIHHPSYFAVFLTMALVGAWYGYFQKWKGFKIPVLLLFTFFNLTMQFFCFSLAGMIFLFLLGVCIFIFLAYTYVKRYVFIGAIILIPVLSVAIYRSNIHIQLEVDSSVTVITDFVNNPVDFIKNNKDTESGSEVRVIMWIVTFQEFKEHPFGVGTGNVDEYLTKRLKQYDQDKLSEHLYNPHNQFLQTGLEIGIFGLCILLMMIGSALYYGWKHKNWILIILLFNLIFNSLFESMLQRQSGIVFYSFWICILIVFSNSNSSVNKLQPGEA